MMALLAAQIVKHLLSSQHPWSLALFAKLTMSFIEIGCAECGCIVNTGVRVIPCGKPDCCCRHLPVRA